MTRTPIPYGITGYGGYVPRLRMQRAAIAAAHRWMSGAAGSAPKGERAFCSWDEDSITMAVEAARDALGQRTRTNIEALTLATTRPAFADLQGASIVAGALELPASVRTLEVGQSQRAGVSGLLNHLRAARENVLFVASDHPSAKPASAQELTYGAGAAAFTLGSEGVIAELIGSASEANLFVDHFRAANGKHDYYWEERWIRDEGYAKIVPATVKAALESAGVPADAVAHFVFAAPLKGVGAAVAKRAGIAAQAVADHLDERCGYAGAAHPCLMLAATLERAQPGEIIAVAGFGQGCDVLILKTTDAIASFSSRRGVAWAIADAQVHGDYLRMLSYDNAIDLEWGMRAEKQVKTAFTEQYRSAHQLGGFVAGKCRCCGTVQFPQLAYCVNDRCLAPALQFAPTALYDEDAQVLTMTADWLSYHPAPPLYVGFVQFDNGARVLMEVTDVGTEGLDVGTPLRMVFRIKDIDKTRNYPRYFWKATPLAA
ncbi:3-oxoacyl-[acyl-carrier-protein] synthase III C-terminal domain-containing protein [Paraburkholderia sp. J11-2]|uniref:3-oxoacyl-[acyl-carrier-protein] synthase III C-terminal domain-containing protein n=1 Tax=Paraburkholderia sp. J11-2 TaxID=2805431 RepID=UPI002AB64828|nr:3-oxoacyl-[acyl-carrier-protein] synthase III C-terminal domain-containing protein [Paraburkholderia sp. J11-2]